MSARVIGSGKWDANDGGVRMTSMVHPSHAPPIQTATSLDQLHLWNIGQIVDVRPRTWAGINRPGGTGRITKIHYASLGCTESKPKVIGLDVKYSVYSGHDLNLDPDLVQPHIELLSRERRRASTIKPATDAENCTSNSNNRCTKANKTLPKRVLVGAKKGSASKKKNSLSRRIGLLGRRKSVPTVLQSSVSPSCVSSEGLPTTSNVPREIVFCAAHVATTPNSGCSKSEIVLDSYSPLGDEGVESQQLSTASYRGIIQSQHLTVNTLNDDNLSADKPQCTVDAMDCEVLHLQISPRPHCDVEMKESLISATPLATGCFSSNREFTFEDIKKETIAKSCAARSHNKLTTSNANNTLQTSKNAACNNASLWDVYDHEVKKASNFIGDVVQGYTSNAVLVHETIKKPSKCDNRLDEFRTLLNDLLFNSDGMIEVATLPFNLKKNAQSSSSTSFDFTESDVEAYLDELCAQNKIMRTEGWIYNI